MPELTIETITEHVGGTLEGGASELVINGINDLAGAREGQLSFLGNPKYLKAALSTKASAILVGSDQQGDFPCVVIRTENPSAAFAKVVEKFSPAPISWLPGVHPTAVVADDVELGGDIHIGPCAVIEPGVKIGRGSHIGAGCYVGHEASIGEDTFLYPNVTVRERTLIGSRVILHPGVVLGSDGFGYEFENMRHNKVPQVGYVQVDDDVEIGSSTTVDRGRFDKTWIQQGAKIDNLVMIAHNVVIGAHNIVVSQSGFSGSTTLGSYVTIAGQVGMVGHVHIGDQATVTGRAAVTKDLPAKGVYRGTPARPFKEAMKIEALTARLPELYKRIQDLEAQLAEHKNTPSSETA